MAIVKDTDKKETPEEAQEDAQPKEDSAELAEVAKAEPSPDAKEGEPAPREEGNVAAPMQLGTRRFVYAAYFAGAIGIAFLASKIIDIAWFRLSQWKPGTIGEPVDEYVLPAAGLIGVGSAIYYWRRGRARKLAEEVAIELSKVSWPGRTEVVNSTFITIVTTLVATVFFALMDRFWGFVTNLVYGT
jgi:preprotein translocase SecE subunit